MKAFRREIDRRSKESQRIARRLLSEKFFTVCNLKLSDAIVGYKVSAFEELDTQTVFSCSRCQTFSRSTVRLIVASDFNLVTAPIALKDVNKLGDAVPVRALQTVCSAGSLCFCSFCVTYVICGPLFGNCIFGPLASNLTE